MNKIVYVVINTEGDLIDHADSFPAAGRIATHKTRQTLELHTVRPVELVRLPSAS